MSKTYTGACLCGTVQFQLQGEFERFYFCYCRYCRKDSGSAHAANLFSSSMRLEWLAGQTQTQTYQLPGTRHTRCFCKVCGSAMPYTIADMVVVPAGSLETDDLQMPDGHLFIASQASWARHQPNTPGFDTLPF